MATTQTCQKAPPALHIPESTDTVEVRVIDTKTLVHLNPALFWQPKIDGFTGLDVPIYCFLISHGDQHVVFDLGVRTDWQNYAPRVVSLIKATTTVTPGTDVASMLDADDSDLKIRSTDIQAVIWSHNHFDHIGDISTFPKSTDLVVGPGVRAISWPGWPQSQDSIVLDSDAEGRSVREIPFETSNLKIGNFDAYDFFGDGSFYLLDAPGHAVGHLCALARTTSSGTEPSFVFMGADACHHPGILRPSDYLSLPSAEVLEGELAPTNHSLAQCPGDLFQSHWNNPGEPFFTVAPGPLFPDHDAAMSTVRKIQELDASDNILVLIAHDMSIRDKIPLFPAKINEWRASGLKRKTRWLFCSDFLPASGDTTLAPKMEEHVLPEPNGVVLAS